MTTRTFTFTVQAAPAITGYPSTAGKYREVSTNLPSDVAPQALKDYEAGLGPVPVYRAVEGQFGVFQDWTSGTFAPELGTAGSYIVWGGGHNGYYGNEVYRYDVATKLWSRMGEPSLYGGSSIDSIGAFPDGKPAPPHNYQTLGILSSANGGGTNGSLIQATLPAVDLGGNGRMQRWWRFDFATSTWSQWLNSSTIGAGNLTQKLMVQEPDSHFWWLGGGFMSTIARVSTAGAISSYNVSTNRGGYDCGGVIPGTRVIVMWGIEGLTLFNLPNIEAGATGATAVKSVATTGTAGNDEDGIVWCSDRNAFAQIKGMTEVATLYWLTPSNPADPWNSTWAWTSETLTAEDGTTPGLIGGGSFSRFVYVPAVKSFLRASVHNRKMMAYRPLGT